MDGPTCSLIRARGNLLGGFQKWTAVKVLDLEMGQRRSNGYVRYGVLAELDAGARGFLFAVWLCCGY